MIPLNLLLPYNQNYSSNKFSINVSFDNPDWNLIELCSVVAF